MNPLVHGHRERRRDLPSWREDAVCFGEDLDTFFPVGDSGPALWQIARAQSICAGCPVREQCLDYALSTGQDHGIWGGLTAQERRELRREGRARGA